MTPADRLIARLRTAAWPIDSGRGPDLGQAVTLADAERIVTEELPPPDADREREKAAANLERMAEWYKPYIDKKAMVYDLLTAAALLRSSPPAWVACSERLPSDSKAQLVRFEDAVFEYGYARYYDGRWRGESGMPRPYEPTHWMPLPDPPGEAPEPPAPGPTREDALDNLTAAHATLTACIAERDELAAALRDATNYALPWKTVLERARMVLTRHDAARAPGGPT